ncbi:MAG: hypothetical protein R3F65_30075 [bacterium]
MIARILLSILPLLPPRPALDRPRPEFQDTAACIVKAHMRHRSCYQMGA